MSVQAMTWALEQQRIADAAARHVLLVLANYADKTGRNAFPAIATLVKETGLSERTVQSKLDLLRGAGLIRLGNQRIASVEIARADRRPKVYDLDTQRGAASAPRECERGADGDRNGVQATKKQGAGVAPDPKSKASKSRTDQEQARRRALELPTWLPADAWKDWHCYRNVRKGWTDKAMALSLGTLAKLHTEGHDPRLVIEQSIERGWSGLFPVHAARPASTRLAPEPKPHDTHAATRARLDAAKPKAVASPERTGAAFQEIGKLLPGLVRSESPPCP